MGRIKLLLVIGGIVLAFFGVQEARLASGAKPEPKAITCGELSASGPGDNAHVSVSDCLPLTQAFVYESKSKSDTSTWSTVWVPVVPRDGEYVKMLRDKVAAGEDLKANLPPPTDIRVLLKSKKVHNQGELAMIESAETLTGLVTNKTESIGSQEKKYLSESYPGIDFTKCYILDHERKPAGSAQIAGMIGGGAVLALLGGGWAVAGSKKSG